MEEPNTFTASDLIHLYLDGETDNVQQSMLFGTLAGSSDLQTEFTEALRIRQAIEHERIHTVPPAHLTQSLFEKAGFVSPAPEIAGAIVVTNGAVQGFLGKLGLPLLAAVASALLTMFFLTQSNQSRYDELNLKLQRIDADNSARPPASRLPVASSASQDTSLRSTARMGASDIDSHRETRPTASTSRTQRRATASDRPRITDAPEASDNSMVEQATAPMEHRLTQAQLRTLAMASHEHGNSGKAFDTSQPLETTDAITAFTERDDRSGEFSLQVRGVTDLQLFPGRNTEHTAQPWHNNMSIGALYQLSEHHAVGLEGGSEFLPLYRSNGAAFILEPRLAWIAGIYRFQAEGIDGLSAIRPFMQTSIGGTLSGPIGRGTLGLAYMPGGPIDFSLGLEGTALFYPLRDNWHSTRKLGLTYLMNVHF